MWHSRRASRKGGTYATYYRMQFGVGFEETALRAKARRKKSRIIVSLWMKRDYGKDQRKEFACKQRGALTQMPLRTLYAVDETDIPTKNEPQPNAHVEPAVLRPLTLTL